MQNYVTASKWYKSKFEYFYALCRNDSAYFLRKQIWRERQGSNINSPNYKVPFVDMLVVQPIYKFIFRHIAQELA